MSNKYNFSAFCEQFVLFIMSVLLVLQGSAQKNASVGFEQWLSLKQVSGVVISPDGKNVVYIVSSTDWSKNTYDTEIWLSRNGEQPFMLTNTLNGNSSNPQFTPDSKWISFLADRGNKVQLYLIAVQGGEAFPITKEDDGVGAYSWSPDGQKIAFVKADQDSKVVKSKKERYGAFAFEGEAYQLNHLWLMDFKLSDIQNAGRYPCYTGKSDSLNYKLPCYNMPKLKRLTEGNFSVEAFEWNPDSKSIAFTKLPDPLINSNIYADLAVVQIADKKVTTLVQNPSGDFMITWSPDGNSILYSSLVNDTTANFYKNNRLFIYQLTTKKSNEILASVDENKTIMEWNKKGIVFNVSQKTKTAFYQFDPLTEKLNEIKTGMDVCTSLKFSKDGEGMAFIGRKFDQLNDVWYSYAKGSQIKLSAMNEQIQGWNIPVNEVVKWNSKDGQEIEGVLIKPANFDPKKKYPLLLVIHGGPAGIDRPEPIPFNLYPIMQWCEKGAVVLRVNYRGSAGYGEKFRSMNVNNLGVGDMWDVMSGVDYLARQGFIDTAKMGCMGWSQGGYISAFLTTNTNRFKAISVGAGISNWVTYYVNTDITPFTRQYLQSTPWDNMKLYQLTSPMTNINKAVTPTLIQHGEFDARVPVANAYELYRGLQDRKVSSKLVLYKGFGHGITKPKERLAAIWHNWQWFNHYVFGEQIESMPVNE